MPGFGQRTVRGGDDLRAQVRRRLQAGVGRVAQGGAKMFVAGGVVREVGVRHRGASELPPPDMGAAR